MKDTPRKVLTNMVYQLVDQDLLARTDGDRPTLRLSDTSWAVMRGERKVRLIQPVTRKVKKTRVEADGWEGVDHGLFEHLRKVRRALAEQRGVPAFVIFGDASLRDMARLKPGSRAAFRRIYGVGEKKLSDFGARFLLELTAYCRDHGIKVESDHE